MSAPSAQHAEAVSALAEALARLAAEYWQANAQKKAAVDQTAAELEARDESARLQS